MAKTQSWAGFWPQLGNLLEPFSAAQRDSLCASARRGYLVSPQSYTRTVFLPRTEFWSLRTPMTKEENVPEEKAVLLATLGTNLGAALSAPREHSRGVLEHRATSRLPEARPHCPRALLWDGRSRSTEVPAARPTRRQRARACSEPTPPRGVLDGVTAGWGREAPDGLTPDSSSARNSALTRSCTGPWRLQ